MSRRRLVALTLVFVVVTAVAGAVGNDRLDDWRVVEDSLRTMHPRYRARWLRDHGHADRLPSFTSSTDSGPLRVVGRWSYGPGYDVDCHVTSADTLIAFGRGSGVTLLSFNRNSTPRVEFLSDVNGERLLNQVMIADSLLYVGTNAGLETYDISDARNPERLSWIRTGCAGFDVQDSLAYITWYDTFKVYSVADPANPYRVGWCRDSGAAVTVTGNTAFLADRWGLYAVDVSDPANPHRVGSWGSAIVEAEARGNICCVTQFNPNQPEWLRLTVLDVASPANMQPVGVLDSAGGYDLQYSRSLLFASGYDQGVHEFEVISLADSTHPTRLGALSTPGPNYGVWGDSTAGIVFVGDGYEGMSTIDVRNLSSPLLLGRSYAAALSVDISMDDSIAYVANEQAGLRILSVSDATRPRTLGELDSVYRGLNCPTAVGKDSFAYFGWFFEFTRVADVHDPTNPQMAAQFNLFRNAEDMVLRDSFTYIAEDYRFQVVNVARPRQPQVVGTCNLPERSREVILADTLAYIANYGGIIVMNVAQPDSPYVVATWPRYIWGIDLQDTVLYALSYANANDDVLLSFSVRNPAAPLLLDTIVVPRTMHDVLVVDTVAYCAGWEMAFVDVSDPSDMRRLPGRWVQPSFYVRRLAYDPPYIYAAATDGGVCILETLQTGVREFKPAESARVLKLEPTVTPGPVRVILGALTGVVGASVYDAAGKEVRKLSGDASTGLRFDLTEEAAGVYMVVVRTAGGIRFTGKLVKTRGR